MEKYTVAQVGIGQRGRTHANAFLELGDRFELVGLCDLDSGKLTDYIKEKSLSPEIIYDDAEKMLAATKPDIFCFVTLPDCRLEMVKLAAKYNVKGLAFEKPMATSILEARTIADICRNAGIKAVVSHQHKYITSFLKLKELLEDKVIGEVQQVNATCQGWLSQLGTHYIDYILWAAGGSRAKWVVGHIHGKELLSDDHPSPNYSMGIVELENGIRASIELGSLSPRHNPANGIFWFDDRLTVYGTHGYIWCDPSGNWEAFTKTSNGKILSGHGFSLEEDSDNIQVLYFKDFLKWMDDDRDISSCNVETAYHGYEILEGLCISALDNTRVDLPLDTSIDEDILARMDNELPDCPEIRPNKK